MDVIDDLDEFWIHEVSVETYTGQATDGSRGFSAATPVTGFLDEKRTLVRDSSGTEVVSSSTLYAPLEHEARFSTLTRVTVRPGVIAEVIAAAPQRSGPLGLPDHVVVSLA